MAKLITSKFDGKNGLFAFISLKPKSVNSLAGILAKYGIVVDKSKLHATLFSSKYTSLPVDFEIPNVEVNALVGNFEVLETEKGCRVVMHLISKKLYRMHNFLKRCSSTEHKYGTFMPHITLIGYDEFKEQHRSSVMALNEMLVHSPLYIELSDIKLSNYGE